MSDTRKYVQAQPFTLYGSGASIGDTSITLSSFALPDGTLLTMTNFGTKGYGTIEPGNGTQEEQISFTGVTQNVNGTATLTGVSHIIFIDPYTETSGVTTSHVGGTTFVLSNTAAFYSNFTNKNDDETITGLWDFPSGSSNPTIGNLTYVAPTGDTQIATKKYVDDVAIAGAPNATTGVKGIIQLPTQAQAEAGTATGSTGASLVLTNDKYGARNYTGYAADVGGTDAYAITLTTTPSAYYAGMIVVFKANTANTGACTINVNSLGAKNIFIGGTNPTDNTIRANSIVNMIYDGTQFNILSISDGITPSATASTIVQRKTDSNITVPTNPSATTDATSKAYVDGKSTAIPQSLLENTGTTSQYFSYATNQAGDNMIVTFRDSGSTGTLAIYRFSKDSGTGQWYNNGDASSITPGGSIQTGSAGIAFIGSFVYITFSYGATTSVIYRFSSTNIAAGGTLMTISGTVPSISSNEHIAYTDGTDLYIHSTGTTWYRYTISGTTATNAQTLTGPSAPQGAWYDGSNVYIFDTAALKKYPASLGAATATTAISANAIVGVGYASSTVLYLISRQSGITGATFFYPITKN